MVDGKRKRPHLFRIVLSHSRKGYSEVVWRQPLTSKIKPYAVTYTQNF